MKLGLVSRAIESPKVLNYKAHYIAVRYIWKAVDSAYIELQYIWVRWRRYGRIKLSLGWLMLFSAVPTLAANVPPLEIQTVEEGGLIRFASSPIAGVTLPGVAGRPHECSREYYPSMSVRLWEMDTILLSMQIAADGHVRELDIDKPSRFTRLNEASLACVKTWSYTPARRDGKPVEATNTVRVTFRLTSEEVPRAYPPIRPRKTSAP